MGKVWERPGRGHGSELFVFLVFPWFFAVWPRTSRTQKKSSDPWARSGLSTHKPKKTKNQKTKKPRNQKTKKPKKQKTKKTKKQKTKKPKNQKTKKTKKTRLHTPRGGGQMQSVGSCLFVFFVFFVFFFWFLGFLVFWFVCG